MAFKHKNFFEPFRSVSNWKTTLRELENIKEFVRTPGMIDEGEHDDNAPSLLEMTRSQLKRYSYASNARGNKKIA